MDPLKPSSQPAVSEITDDTEAVQQRAAVEAKTHEDLEKLMGKIEDKA